MNNDNFLRTDFLYDNFYTKRGSELAAGRKVAAKNFYESMLAEVRECYEAEPEDYRRYMV